MNKQEEEVYTFPNDIRPKVNVIVRGSNSLTLRLQSSILAITPIEKENVIEYYNIIDK